MYIYQVDVANSQPSCWQARPRVSVVVTLNRRDIIKMHRCHNTMRFPIVTSQCGIVEGHVISIVDGQVAPIVLWLTQLNEIPISVSACLASSVTI